MLYSLSSLFFSRSGTVISHKTTWLFFCSNVPLSRIRLLFFFDFLLDHKSFCFKFYSINMSISKSCLIIIFNIKFIHFIFYFNIIRQFDLHQYLVGDNLDTLERDLSKFLIDPFFRLGE